MERRRLPEPEPGLAPPFAVQSFREVYETDVVWEEHAHLTHELLWNERGASSARVGSRIWTITPRLGLWIPAGLRHSGWAPAGTGHRAAQFSVEVIDSIAPGVAAIEITPLLHLLLDRLFAEELDGAQRARTEAVISDLLTPAARELVLHVPGSGLLEPIAAAVLADPAQTVPLTAWAERLMVSPRTITRAFRAETGLGFEQWVTAARVQHAVTLLAQGERVEDVAEAVGYRSASAFGAAFRRVTGTTPGRFRPY